MNLDEQRRVENFCLVCPLKDVEDIDMLVFMASLIQDHDHLREKLMTEPSIEKRKGKFEAMRANLSFKALPLDAYMTAEVARSCGVQPIYEEQRKVDANRIHMPESRIHEVRG